MSQQATDSSPHTGHPETAGLDRPHDTGDPMPDTSTPSPAQLQELFGYGTRDLIPRPTRSAYHLSPGNKVMAGNTPILRRLRPLVLLAEGEGVPVTHLAVGSLKRTPPDYLYEYMQADGRHPEGYPQSFGHPRLLGALSTYLSNLTGLKVKPGDNCVTRAGVDNAEMAVRMLTEIGDTVVVIRPSWPNTMNIIRELGRRAFSLHVRPEDNWEITSELLAKVPKNAKLLIIERPGNPTARTWTERELSLAKELLYDRAYRDLVIYADEEYYEIGEGRPRSILEIGCNRTISGSAWSKNICATSARLGRMTSLDRRIRSLFRPYWNVRLGSNNWMGIQEALAGMMLDFSSKGMLAYVHRLNVEMRGKRERARRILTELPHSQLLTGTGAIYDNLILEDDDDATQMMMWQLVRGLQHARSGADGAVPRVAYAVPLSGFQDDYDGYSAKQGEGTPRKMIHGFRVTHTVSGSQHERALHDMVNGITGWREAGRPNLGSIEDVIAAATARQPIALGRTPLKAVSSAS